MPSICRRNVYLDLFRKAIAQTIFRTPLTIAAATLVFAMTFFATRMLVRISDSIVDLTNTFRTSRFDAALSEFFMASCIALFLKYLPRILYSALVQEICRRQFVSFTREYLALDYASFHRKTPGEIRYAIFLKSFSSVMCAHLVIFEFSAMLGVALFSFQKMSTVASRYSALVFVVSPTIYLAAVAYYIGLKLVVQTEYLRQQEKVSSKLFDKLVNYDVIKTYNLEGSESTAFFGDLSGQMEAQLGLGLLEARGSFAFSLILVFPYILLVVFAFSAEPAAEERHSGLFKTTLLYISMSSQIKRLGIELISLMMCLNQIRYSDVEGTPCADEEAGKEEVGTFEGSIALVNVTLYYGETPVVRDINAVIRRGEKIGIVGPNGTGKSTFIKALLGFTEFTGDIFFDDRNTRGLSWRSIVRQISYVPQEDYTSDDTVMNNLRLGARGASDEFIVGRARAFGAHEAFAGLPRGYETEAGPRGNRLSGGQLQRLSLVRAAVKDAPIFILDEATAAMDKRYEGELVERLFGVLGDRTLIMIVHGREHLRRFDRLFFFNDGLLEHVGTYEQLMRDSQGFRLFVG